jgi:predicted PurR-regulated permease PerM
MAAHPQGGPTAKTLARMFFTIAAFAAGIYLLYLVRDVLGLILIAIFLAVALGPAVDWFHRRRVPRGLAILITYISIFLLIVGIGALVVPPIVQQVNEFANEVPTYIQEARNNPTIREYDARYDIIDKLENAAEQLPERLGDAAATLQAVTVGVFSTIIQLVTVLTMTFFLLLDGGALWRWLASLFGREREEQVRVVSRDVYRAVAGYMAGNFVISLIAGTLTYIVLTVIGVPFAVPLAIFMAFVDIIPVIGSVIGGFGIGLVTLLADFPTATIAWTVFVLIYQQVENNLIQPIVYRKTVDVAPLFVIIAVLIGTKLLGILGALVAIPVAAGIQILVRDIWSRRTKPAELLVVEDEGKPDPVPPGPQPVPPSISPN